MRYISNDQNNYCICCRLLVINYGILAAFLLNMKSSKQTKIKLKNLHMKISKTFIFIIKYFFRYLKKNLNLYLGYCYTTQTCLGAIWKVYSIVKSLEFFSLFKIFYLYFFHHILLLVLVFMVSMHKTPFNQALKDQWFYNEWPSIQKNQN